MQVNNLALDGAVKLEKQRHHTVVKRPISKKTRRKRTIIAVLRVSKIFVIAITLLLLFSTILFSNTKLIKLEHEIATTSSMLNDAKSEHTRLAMTLSSMVSAEKIDEYAVSVLGMHKLEPYQIYYFDDNDDDKVLIAGGEVVNN